MRKKPVWSILLLLCIAFPFLFGACSKRGGDGSVETSGPWEEKKQALEEKYGVQIEFDNIEFPEHWMRNNPKWTPVAPGARFSALGNLEHDLSKYTLEFLKKHLNRIFIFSSLSFNGSDYGGTNDHNRKWLYIHYKWLGDTGHLNAMGFHHEFSSILLKLYSKRNSLENNWKGSNMDGFEYVFDVSSSKNIASRKTDTRGNTNSYKRGFICEYGELTFEDDLNTFSEFLVAKPGVLNDISGLPTHEIVKKKTELLYDFYTAIGF